MSKKEQTFTYLINLTFWLYFVILLTERTISVILSITNGVNIYSNPFNGYVYTLVFISIISWLVFTLIRCRGSFISLFSKDKGDISFKDLCISSGIILLSGMVHTEYTIPVIQFVSYGILILGILLKVILINEHSKNRLLLWLSFIYLVALSMAIPVMYHSFIKLHVLFHILEGIASFLLVGTFTYLLLRIFNEEENLFSVIPILLVVGLDTPIVILRWNEEINFFVLIFLCLSVVLFVVGFVLSHKKKTM